MKFARITLFAVAVTVVLAVEAFPNVAFPLMSIQLVNVAPEFGVAEILVVADFSTIIMPKGVVNPLPALVISMEQSSSTSLTVTSFDGVCGELHLIIAEPFVISASSVALIVTA